MSKRCGNVGAMSSRLRSVRRGYGRIRRTPVQPEYQASKAPDVVREAFACARRWHRIVYPRRLDGAPCPGALAELVVEICRQGVWRRMRRGNKGHDFRNRHGRRTQVKAIGSDSRSGFQFPKGKGAEHVIVLRIFDRGWTVLYDGPAEPLIRGRPPLKGRPDRVFVGLANLRRNGRPDTWRRFWQQS